MSRITRFFFLLLAVAGATGFARAQVDGDSKMIRGDHSFSSSSEVLPVPAQDSFVSFRPPDGLVLSTGNLYFTSHDSAGASVWRADQNSVPGKEILLYWEAGARFGDIVFAQVDGVFFGYFFAETTATFKGFTIKRVPLTGGTATVLANIGDEMDIENSHRNLVTDGANLYWQDGSAIRKMPIRGGAIVKLDPVNPNTPTAGIELQNGSQIVYASVQNIRFVPISGTNTTPESRTIAVAASRVTALHAVSNGTYWGDQGPDTGSLHLRVAGVNTTLPGPSGIVTSISTKGPAAGGSQAWTVCSGDSCRLRLVFPSLNSSTVIGNNALGVTVTSSGTVFWGDAAGVHRKVF
jgi:hypothetical protein